MRNFRLLKKDEIEARIATIKENGVSVLLYKTARTDYALLDEVVGMYNWQNKYQEIDGKMYCGIGILPTNSSEWIWKWNCGSESNQEAEKGQASDAMKRAGFAWGIGTELYSAPFIWIPSDKCKIIERNGKYYCNDSFTVTSIDYDENEDIKSLVICNSKTGNLVYSYGTSNYTLKATKASTSENKADSAKDTSEDKYVKEQNGIAYAICEECGEYIYDMKKRGGGTMPVKEYVAKCLQSYGKPLCSKCRPK